MQNTDCSAVNLSVYIYIYLCADTLGLFSATPSPSRAGESGQGSLSNVLPLSFIPTNETLKPSNLDTRVDTLLSVLCPCVESQRQRERIHTYVSAMVKKALGAVTFEVGAYASRSYLPDEELSVSAFLCRGQDTTWYVLFFLFFFYHFAGKHTLTCLQQTNTM